LADGTDLSENMSPPFLEYKSVSSLVFFHSRFEEPEAVTCSRLALQDYYMRTMVLVAVRTKSSVFWDMTPSSFVCTMVSKKSAVSNLYA
jgi:hypothetical protein